MTNVKATNLFHSFMWAVLAAFATAGIAGAWGCGSSEPQDLEVMELDQAEQPVSVEVNGYGWRSDGTNVGMQCSGGSTSQVCNVPATKTVRVKVDTTGMVAVDIPKATAQRDALITAYNNQYSGNGWSFSSQTSNLQIEWKAGTVSNLGAADDWRQFARPSCVSFSTLTETVDGSYRACGSIVVTVDYDKIFGTFGDAGMSAALKHIMGASMQMRAGVGLQTNDSTRISFNKVSATAARNTTMTSREQCRVRALVTGGGSVSFTNNC